MVALGWWESEDGLPLMGQRGGCFAGRIGWVAWPFREMRAG
jgi:hypothetical protein